MYAVCVQYCYTLSVLYNTSHYLHYTLEYGLEYSEN